jgi:hypothetical protein
MRYGLGLGCEMSDLEVQIAQVISTLSVECKGSPLSSARPLLKRLYFESGILQGPKSPPR